MIPPLCTNNQVACMELLLRGGAELEARTRNGVTPLGVAAQRGATEAAAFLLRAGASARARGSLGFSPLIEAILHKRHDALTSLLIPHSDLGQYTTFGTTALHAAVHTGNETALKLLLPVVADVDVRTVPGVDASGGRNVHASNQTALHIASSKAQLEMVKSLVKKGSCRTARDSNGCTPAHLAAAHGNLSCLVVLLGRVGSYKLTVEEVNAANVLGGTPLHLVAELSGSVQCVKALLGAGADPGRRMNDGRTALMLAQQHHAGNQALLDALAGSFSAGSACDHCGRPDEPAQRLKSCNACRSVLYCGAACQAAAWRAHRPVCVTLEEKARDATRVAPVPDK